MTSTEAFDRRLLGGRYRLEEKIGQGGMGLVVRAIDVVLSREVAIKLLTEETTTIDEEIASRFLREAQNTARLAHENIVSVYDFGREPDGSLYFVMELCRGETLSSALRRQTRLPVTEAVHVATQICAALAVAHQHGVIHRDLKPANVMLVPTPQDPLFVKVLDFGVAKSIQAGHETTQLTRTGMIVGTVEYMAPEQIIGRPVDARTDIYALGVLLYRMLAGSPVFIEQGVPAIIHNHLNTEPESICKRAPEANVPRSLDKVVQRCLAKRPEGRYATMGDVTRAIREALDVGLAALPDLGFEDDRESWAKTEVAASPFDDVYDPHAPTGEAPHDEISVEIDLEDELSSQETRVARRSAATIDTPIPPAIQRSQKAPKTKR